MFVEWRTPEQVAEAAMRHDRKLAAKIHNLAYAQGDISAENKARIYRELMVRPHDSGQVGRGCE